MEIELLEMLRTVEALKGVPKRVFADILMDCIFCHLDRSILAETKLSCAVPDSYPVSKGHSLFPHASPNWVMERFTRSPFGPMLRFPLSGPGSTRSGIRMAVLSM